jgi:rRNA maturation RNase YbeY
MSGDLRLLNRQRARPVDLRLLRRALLNMLDELSSLSPPEGERAGLSRRSPAKAEVRGPKSLTNEFDITIHLVTARAMARLNEKHLQHEGPTDVITLDYASSLAAELPHALSPQKGERAGVRGPKPVPSALVGEIFVCMDVAVEQARRFRAAWPVELARYVIHGILHLSGHDDRRPAARRRMKQAENRWLKKLDRRFRLSKLGRKRRLTA